MKNKEVLAMMTAVLLIGWVAVIYISYRGAVAALEKIGDL